MKYGTILSFIIIFLVLHPIKSYSQKIYQTKEGTLEIFTSEPQLVAHSKDLRVILDYTNARADFELPLAAIHVTSDSLNKRRHEIEDSKFILKVELGIDHINTQNHPRQHFHFQGDLEYNNLLIPIEGDGQLEHLIGNEEISCLLGLHFWLSSEALGKLNIEIPGIDSMKVQVVQTVLNEKI